MLRNLQLSRTRVALLAAALAALALIAALAAGGDRSLMSDSVHMIPMTLSEGAAVNDTVVNDQGALLFSDDDAHETGLISPATLAAAGLALSTALFIALIHRRSLPRYIVSRRQHP